MATHYRRCAGITVKGHACRKNGNCPIHVQANYIRRRMDDENAMETIRKANRRAEQMTIEFIPSRDRIKELIEIGRQQAIAEEMGLGSFPCGCLG